MWPIYRNWVLTSIFSILWSRHRLKRESAIVLKGVLYFVAIKLSANHNGRKVINYNWFMMTLDKEKDRGGDNIYLREVNREDIKIKNMSFILYTCIYKFDKTHVQEDYCSLYLHSQPYIYLFVFGLRWKRWVALMWFLSFLFAKAFPSSPLLYYVVLLFSFLQDEYEACVSKKQREKSNDGKHLLG